MEKYLTIEENVTLTQAYELQITDKLVKKIQERLDKCKTSEPVVLTADLLVEIFNWRYKGDVEVTMSWPGGSYTEPLDEYIHDALREHVYDYGKKTIWNEEYNETSYYVQEC